MIKLSTKWIFIALVLTLLFEFFAFPLWIYFDEGRISCTDGFFHGNSVECSLFEFVYQYGTFGMVVMNMWSFGLTTIVPFLGIMSIGFFVERYKRK